MEENNKIENQTEENNTLENNVEKSDEEIKNETSNNEEIDGNKVSWFVSFVRSEIFLYLVVGGLTTLVNLASFYFLSKAFNVSENNSAGWKLAEILAFIIALVFAFIANKIFVFKSIDMSSKILSKEIIGFSAARILTEVINFFIMWIMIDKKGRNEFLTKVFASVVVIVLNYIFSKFFIFKNNTNSEKV